ncbi:hypothetical protein VNO77_39390 [Canavalia gladiata]|uniref:Uncharacterized protein n=1 Tax=Canavalia gladiata TaxID=3824 RepID=A0AAN9PZQ8_CANGL
MCVWLREEPERVELERRNKGMNPGNLKWNNTMGVTQILKANVCKTFPMTLGINPRMVHFLANAFYC